VLKTAAAEGFLRANPSRGMTEFFSFLTTRKSPRHARKIISQT